MGSEQGTSSWLGQQKFTLAQSLLLAFLLAQSLGLVTQHPYGLSYYNLLVGGLPGAGKLGLELTYWSESVDRRLLHQLARHLTPGETAALAPTLAPGQGVMATGRALLGRRVFLDDEEKAPDDDYLVVYRRSAYWKAEVRRRLDDGEVVAENSRFGVWLSRLIRRPNRGSPSGHAGGNR